LSTEMLIAAAIQRPFRRPVKNSQPAPPDGAEE